jgi:alpha-galactosidase
VGNPGLTLDQQQAQVSAWAVIASPLLISTTLVDPAGIPNATLAILSAPEVIAVSQDALLVQGERVTPPNPDGAECWARPLASGGVAVLYLNRGPAPAVVLCTWAQIGLPSNASCMVRDLWARANVGAFTQQYGTQVAGTSALLLSVTAQ